MPLTVTRHEGVSNYGRLSDYAGPQLDDSVVIGDGTVSDPLPGGYYRVKAAGNVMVRFGDENLVDASAGEPWSDGETDMRKVPEGAKIACDLA